MKRYAALTLVVGPAAGAALLVTAFTVLRPVLPLSAWTLDLMAIAAGVAGLIAGGTIAAAQPINPAVRQASRWTLAGAWCANAVIVTLVLMLAGVPVLWWYVAGAVVAAGALVLLPRITNH